MTRRSYLEPDAPHPTATTRRSLLTGLAATAGAMGLGGAGYAVQAFGLLRPAPALDRATGCRAGGAAQTAVVLVDATDPLTDIHAGRLRATLHRAAEALPQYGRLLVFTLNPDDPGTPRQLFGRCAPRSPERTGPLEGGSIYVRREWDRLFATPLQASVADVVASKTHDQRSPIMQTIATLTQRADFDASTPDRHLLIVSDMLEHDPGPPGYSHLRRGNLIEGYKRSSFAATVRADLRGVHVAVDYLQRTDPVAAVAQNQAHREFWRWWFHEAGATDVNFLGVRETAAEPAPAPARKPVKNRYRRHA